MFYRLYNPEILSLPSTIKPVLIAPLSSSSSTTFITDAREKLSLKTQTIHSLAFINQLPHAQNPTSVETPTKPIRGFVTGCWGCYLLCSSVVLQCHIVFQLALYQPVVSGLLIRAVQICLQKTTISRRMDLQ